MEKVTQYTMQLWIRVPTDEEGPDIDRRGIEKLVLRLLNRSLGYDCDGEVMDTELLEGP